MAVVKTEAGNFGLFGPIWLRLRKHLREERQHERRRMLTFEHRVTGIFKSELGAKVRDSFRLVSALRQPQQEPHDAWSKHVESSGPLPERRHGWIVSRIKREQRQHGRDPRHAELAAHEWTGRRCRMRDQQIRARNSFK